jgi:hypothetical protein
MEGLLKSLSQSSAEIILVTLVLLALTLFVSVRNAILLKRERAKWQKLLSGADGGNLEKLLMDGFQSSSILTGRIGEAEVRIKDLEQHAEKSKRHLGLVRYDAFEDVGGSQSFALALYDDNGDGIVLNGIVGRMDCRVYCKPLVGGRSDRNLSQEEKRAIEDALSRAPKSVVT